jgi:hypothetical protein
MTFLGDCTLGGEEKKAGQALSFASRIAENGMDFPFRGLKALTGTDDLTVANLEVVLSDRKLKKEKKEFNFIGPTANTQILTEGSIESVTVANNHTHDYGDEGYTDTKAALDEAGVGWFGTDAPGIWRSDGGLMIGFLGVNYSLTGNRAKRFAAQAEKLRDLGCAVIIFTAAFQSIPEPLYEYARLEGAGFFRQTFGITLPLVIPTAFLVIILEWINAFKIFKEVYFIGGAYPDESVYTLQNYMNNMYGKLNYQNVTTAAYSFAVIVFALFGALFLLQRRLLRKLA